MVRPLERHNAYRIVQALERAKRERGEDSLSETARNSAGRLVPMPRTHPFRDPTRFTYSGELAGLAKSRGIAAYDQLAIGQSAGNLSRLANLQAAYGKPLDVYASYSPKHSANSQHKLGKAFDINLSTSVPERERLLEIATRMGFTGTGT